jgi:nuclear transport factor 2 (NTF2) superfamily protein
MTEEIAPRMPVPPFSEQDARQKVLMAENAWNTKDPVRVAGAYTADSVWRNRDEFIRGRDEIEAFLTRKWERERDYVLRKDLWAFTDNHIAVRFQYEWRNAEGQWFRSYGNENWEFDSLGYMARREASINDVPIEESQRRIFGPREESDTSGIPLE